MNELTHAVVQKLQKAFGSDQSSWKVAMFAALQARALLTPRAAFTALVAVAFFVDLVVVVVVVETSKMQEQTLLI